jgi:hypothetical protein
LFYHGGVGMSNERITSVMAGFDRRGYFPAVILSRSLAAA